MNETYNVAVKLSLHNQVSAGLIAMSGQFTKLQAQATALQARLNSIRTLALTGMALFGAGAIGVYLLDKMIKPASEYQHQLAQLNNTGLDHLKILEATKAAWDTLKVAPTSSVAENLESIKHLRMVFGGTDAGFHEALNYLPTIQKVQAILRSARGHDTSDESYELAKALELKGAVKSPELFVTQANEMTKAIVASGGKIGASDFLGAMKWGRLAAQGWNDDFTYTILPTLMQEMKTRGGSGGAAGGPGNALQSMYAAIVGGTISQKALKVWDSIGLLDSSKEVWNKVGSLKGVEPGGVKNWQQFMANPFEWSQKTLLPALLAAGYKTEASQKQAIQYLFPNRTAGFIATQMVEQGWKFKRDQELIKQAKGIGGYETLLKEDPQLAKMALQKQWQSLMAILGYQIMPALLDVATALIPAITDLATFFKENTWAAKAFVFSLVGLSAALLISGSVLLLAAAFKGLALTMTLLSAPLLALGAPILITIGLLSALAFGFYELWPTIKKIDFGIIATKFKELITSIINMIKHPFSGAGSSSQIPKPILQSTLLSGMANQFGFNHIDSSVKQTTVAVDKGSTNTVNAINTLGDKLVSSLSKFVSMQQTAINAIGSKMGNFSPKTTPTGKPTASNVHSNSTIQVATNINLDGRHLARVVTQHQVNDAIRIPNYTQGYDPNMSPTPMVLKGNIA